MDKLRALIRGRIGYKHPSFVFAARTLFVCSALLHGGTTGLKLVRMRSGRGSGVWVRLRRLLFPIYVRPGTKDIGSIVNNIFREEYGKFPAGFAPATIIDAGAYIGDTSAYFLSRFKQAKLIALEPNSESHAVALDNLASYGERVQLLQRALWDTEGVVHLSGQETGASISEHGSAVQTETIPRLMQQMGAQRLGLLKMDIEGAEVTVLKSGANGWLRQIDVLLLETHGKDIEAAVLPLLRAEGFDIRRHRNVWYCFNRLAA